MRKTLTIIGGVLLLLLVGGGAFYGGMSYERSQVANTQAAFFAERGGRPEGFGGAGVSGTVPAQGGAGRGVFGKVKSIKEDTLLLSTAQDVTTVILTDQTTITRFVAGQREDLQPGQQVTVIGESGEDGVVTATSIQILAEEP